MRFFSKRLGLIVWAVVALAILVVPQWRLRASWQWQSPFLFDNSAWFTTRNYGLTGPWEREAARRFPDNAVAQLAPLSHPDFSKFGSARENDPKLHSAIADYLARYDALERRFPASNAVRAQRLLDVTRGKIYIDQGPQPDYDGRPFPIATDKSSWLSRAEFDAAIRSARAGARLEPDNAFFPWMEAICQFAVGRDAAALSALRKAGTCTRFDDHIEATVRERLGLLGKLRATGWEADFSEMSNALLPHLARMRTAARAAMGRARLARARGDQARALEIAGIVQRAGAVVERTQGLLITKLVGRAICQDAWETTLENEPDVPARPKSSDQSFIMENADEEAYSRQIAARFARYARAHNRPDLASQALAIAAKFDARQLSDVYKKLGIEDFLANAETLAKASWIGSNALVFGCWASLLWALTWPFSRRAADAKARRQSLLWAMFIAGVTLVLVVATLQFSPQGIFQFWNSTGVTDTFLLVNPDGRKWLALLWIAPTLVALLVRLFPFLSGVAIGRFKRDGNANWPGIGHALLLFGFIAGFLGVAVGLNQTADSLFGQLFVVSILLWLGCALAGSLLMLALYRGQKRVIAFCIVGAFWAVVASLLIPSGGDGPFYALLLRALAGLLVVTALVLALRIWKFPVDAVKDFAFQLAARTRVVAGVLALLCALAYLGIALWTVPVERRARAQMQRQLQIGEVAWLREQSAAPR